jgi:hypothetical protein
MFAYVDFSNYVSVRSISMSAFIKQAIEKQLKEQGIDWKKEK